MTKGNIQWKWIAVIAVVTVLAVAITLGICILQKEELCAPGFTYENFVDLRDTYNAKYVATPQGDVLVLEGTNYTCVTSADHQTQVGINDNHTLTVMSRHGVQTVNQTVNKYYYDALRISFYGDAVYFFDNENLVTGVNTLWRYDVATNTTVQMDAIEGAMYPGVVSPNGKYFAAVDASGDTRVVVYLYEDGEKIRTWKMDSFVELYHLTDDGTLFFRDVTAELKSIQDEEPVVFMEASGSVLDHILFNRDATEIILNMSGAVSNAGCYYYEVEQDGGIKSQTKLKEAGEITLFPMAEEAGANTMKVLLGQYHAVLDVASFRDINLLDTETGQRVKLTKRDINVQDPENEQQMNLTENALVYQENSETMQGMLVPSGKYILYIDANGDYFYTDTEDTEGAYHLFWEASKCDVDLVLHVTGQKSIYYQDSEMNLHYTNGKKDVCLLSAEEWSAGVSTYTVEDATDTLYFILDDVLYYAHKGGSVKKMADIEKLFPVQKDIYLIIGDTAAGVYCYGRNRIMEEENIVFYRLYPDGSYHLME